MSQEQGQLGEVLHEVTDRVLYDLGLGHALRAPALLVERGQLDASGEPDGEVVVQGASLLEFGAPDVAQGSTAPFAPLADRFEAGRDVPRTPILDASVGQRDEPDVLTVAWR